MSILVFDTETTGLPPRGAKFARADTSNYLGWRGCRLVQIAWEIRSVMDYAVLVSRAFVIKPDGFVIPDKATEIHGISQAQAESEGIPIIEVLDMFFRDIASFQVSRVVAHNMSFDDNVMLAELFMLLQMLRQDMCSQSTYEKWLRHLEAWVSIPKICTMRMGTKPNGKWPKLDSLYREVCGKEPEGTLHNACVDTRLCAEIYRALTYKDLPV